LGQSDLKVSLREENLAARITAAIGFAVISSFWIIYINQGEIVK
jgi:hypothetical protein